MTRSGTLVATACVLLAPMLGAQPVPTCEQWNMEEFFRAATVEDVTACLDAGSDVSARTEYGYTPLHHAAEDSERPEVVGALLAAGAHPDPRDHDGDTPLSLAAFTVSSRSAVVESLLAAGANPRTRNELGRMALHYAAAVWKAPEIAALLAAGDAPGRSCAHLAKTRSTLVGSRHPNHSVLSATAKKCSPVGREEIGLARSATRTRLHSQVIALDARRTAVPLVKHFDVHPRKEKDIGK